MSKALELFVPKSGVVLDNDAVEIGTLYRKARTSIVDSVKFSIEAGMRLIAKKDSLEHGEWLPWLKANSETLGFEGRATATRLMKLASNGASTQHLEAPEALRISRELWGNDNVRGTQGTGENEWFTPPEYIELARQVLGEIDLDPASSDEAQRIIQAAQYFTKTDDGLKQEWCGRIWLNPPYAQPFIAEFASKMVAERCAGRVEAAIMLTHNYTDTAWFHELAGEAAAICFMRGRVKFYSGDEIAAPTQGQAFFYFGDEVSLFVERFKSIGFVTRPC
jgi:ParB family chromosome partitioning protein